MELSFHSLGLFNHPKKEQSAKVIKFNRFNLIFNGDKKLKEGQVIFLSMSAGLHTLREVRARVEECEPCGPHYRCQVKFVLERPDNQPYTEAISILKALEQAIPASLRAPLHMQKA